jgi:hypothetical protein
MRKIKAPTCPVSTITTNSPPNGVSARLVLTIPDYGDRYHVKKYTVWTWIRRGLPNLNLGSSRSGRGRKLVMIPVAEADAWIDRNFLVQH